LIKKIRKKAKESFTREPVYLETDLYEGYLIPWPNWYGYGEENATKVEIFREFLENSLCKFFGNNYLEEILSLDWIDEDNFEYIDLSKSKQYSEVFRKSYRNGDVNIEVYNNFLNVGHYSSGLWVNIGFYNNQRMKLEIKGDALPIFEKLKRRGLYDIDINYPDVGI